MHTPTFLPSRKLFAAGIAVVAQILSPLALAAPDEAKLRAATAIVTCSEAGERVSLATGTLIYAKDGLGYILTTDSAIANSTTLFKVRDGVVSVEFVPRDPFEKCLVKLGGEVLQPKIISRDKIRNLAVLSVRPKNPTLLSPFKKPPVIRETAPVKICAPDAGGELVVVPSSISSLRKNDAGELAFIQLDGRFGKGSSGAPVIDASGNLLGIIAGGMGDRGITFVVPVTQLLESLSGDVANLIVKSIPVGADKVRVDAKLEVIDPFKRVRSLNLVLSKDGKKQRAPFKVDAMNATASIVLSGKSESSADYSYSADFVIEEEIKQSTESAFRVRFGEPLRSDISAARWVHAELSERAPTINSPAVPKPLPTGRVNEKWKSILGSQENIDAHDCLEIGTKGYLYKSGFIIEAVKKSGRELRRLPLGFHISWWGTTSEGIAVYTPEFDQLWLVDPATLTVKRRFAIIIEDSEEIESSPNSAIISGETLSDRKLEFDVSTGNYNF